MRHRLRRLRPTYSGVTATLALVVAMGGGAYAMTTAKAPPRIRACADRHTGQARLLKGKARCHRSERLVTWNAKGPKGARGARGATGAVGQRGPQGDRGPAGTVDTSQFYSKTQSDARFLGLHATADDAQAVGGLSSPELAQSDNTLGTDPSGTNLLGTYREEIAAGTLDVIYPVPHFLGELQASCDDPASTTTLHYVFNGAPGSVQVVHGATDSYVEGVVTTPNVSLAGADHATYVVGYPDGSASWIDVFTKAGPGTPPRNACSVRVFYHRFLAATGP